MPHTINQDEINMLRSELEILMKERAALLKVAGVAASLVAELDSRELPIATVEAADLLAASVNDLSDETLKDALSAVHAEIVA